MSGNFRIRLLVMARHSNEADESLLRMSKWQKKEKDGRRKTNRDPLICDSYLWGFFYSLVRPLIKITGPMMSVMAMTFCGRRRAFAGYLRSLWNRSY